MVDNESLNPLRSPRDRYHNDPLFHLLVDTLLHQIIQCNYTPSELREAAVLACILYAEKYDTSRRVYMIPKEVISWLDERDSGGPWPGKVVRKEPEDDVKWIVNDLGELGVEVNGRFLFLYKGDSLEYGGKDGACLHDDGTPMLYRMVGKREFGETQWPQKWVIAGRREDRYTEKLAFHEGLSFGKPEDGDWKPLPASNAKDSEE